MADSAQFWGWVSDTLRQNSPLILLLVVDSQGSSPGTAGAKMALRCDGAACGTIGGGAVEDGLLQKAQQMLASNAATPQLYRQQHRETSSAEASGNICGGEQTVLLYPCHAEDLPTLAQLAACCAQRREAVLSISAAGMEILPAVALNTDIAYSPGERWRYCERFGARNNAYIVGGGHVSIALSQVLALLNFDITVIDVRSDLATMRDNSYARCKLLRSYEELAAAVPEGPRQFVFIMTHDHVCDALAVRQLAEKRLRYLGVLGSRGKIARMKESLAAQLDYQALQRLRAPMGLPIGSHTPAEIAVSIAAEVVQELHGLTA